MIEVDVWVRGTLHAETCHIKLLPPDPSEWREGDVRTLLTEMLLALERRKNPGGEPPVVTLRGFSWIVTPYESGVLIHLEMQMGTASAGPLAIDERQLSAMVTRVIAAEDTPQRIH
jgi:hypothetical protein